MRAFDAWREGHGCTGDGSPDDSSMGGLRMSTSTTSLVSTDGLTHPGATGARAAARGVETGPLALVLAFDVLALSLAALAARGSMSPPHVLSIAVIVVLALSGSYRIRITMSALEEAPGVAVRVGCALLVVLPLVDLESGVGAAYLPALAATGLLVVGRGASYGVIRAARRRGRLSEPTVLVGGGVVAAEIVRRLREHPEYGLDPVGFVDAQQPGRFADPRLVGLADPAPGRLDVPRLGDVQELCPILVSRGVRRVIVAFGASTEKEMVTVLRAASLDGVEVFIVPRFFDVGLGGYSRSSDSIWGMPVRRLRPLAVHRLSWRFKRALDVVVAGLGLLLAAPLMLVIAVAIKLSSPGPVLFRQHRVGRYGGEFTILKFRSMPANHVPDTWNAAVGEDTFAVGRLLRRSSLDELPQLWNVLRGDMSLVGPRPEIRTFVEEFSRDVDGYYDRHRFPAGLTGWAQVNGMRAQCVIEERAQFDNQYIEHWSLWLDVVILMRTVTTAVRDFLTRRIERRDVPEAVTDEA